MEFTFTLKYKLPEHESDLDDVAERLTGGGCDDALIGIGQPGRIAIEFMREAPSAIEAFSTALEDVKRAVPGAVLIEATPDLVGLTDVADIIGVTRQNMRKLAMSHTKTFPAPVHAGSATIWHLAEVLFWMQSRKTYNIPQVTIDTAQVAMHVNIKKEQKRIASAPDLLSVAL